MENLIRVVYVCSTTVGINEHEILRLLKQARIANRKQDVSGMLLYIGGFFLQTLEGEPAMVDAVSGTIFRDKPRMRLTQMARESIAEREFSEWTMGFATVDPLEAGRLLGDEGLFRSAASIGRLDAQGAKTLLTIFGRRRYQSDRSGMYKAITRSA
jgi:hypothetical protein